MPTISACRSATLREIALKALALLVLSCLLGACTLLPSLPGAQAPVVRPSVTAKPEPTPGPRATATRRPQASPPARATAAPQPATTAIARPQPTAQPVRPLDGFKSATAAQLPEQARQTLALIARGGPFPHRQDGAMFQNRERRLPRQPSGYYHEYTVETPGSDDRGARRIITGAAGEIFYTADHYASFIQVLPT